MKRKTLLTCSIAGSILGIAASAAALQNPGSDRDDFAKAQLFEKVTNGPAGGGSNPCVRMAWAGRKAGNRDASADLYEGLTAAVNIEDSDDQWEAVLEAFDGYDEALELNQDQFHARLDLCDLLGQDGTYEPEIDPEDFGPDIDHPLLPWTPGTTWIYELDTDEEYELIHVTVLEETREIMGVECRVVRDTVWVEPEDDDDLDDEELELVEDTFDYYAQDGAGNVWYMGEISMNYEDGYLTDLEGSWLAGEDSGHAGIVMPAGQSVGQTYRQEFLPFEAEDAATILSLNATAEVPFGTFDSCLQTGDFTPLEPDSYEHKFYAPGVGMVLEVDPDSGDRLELIDILTD